MIRPGPSSSAVDLDALVTEFARSLGRVDARSPVATNARTGKPYQPGIGPHPETQAVELITAEMADASPDRFGEYETGVPYPEGGRRTCDWCVGEPPVWDWAIMW